VRSDLGSIGRKPAVVLDAWERQDLPEDIRFTRKAYIALANPDECEIGEAAIQNFGHRVNVAEPGELQGSAPGCASVQSIRPILDPASVGKASSHKRR
jgi:hypothetical protein